MSSNEERTARKVMETMARVTFLLRDHAVIIGRLPSVNKTLTALEFYDSVNGPPILSGYSEAQLKNGGAISWLLDVTWTDDNWTIESEVVRSVGGEQETIQKLPMIVVRTVDEFPQTLAEAVRHLLDIRPSSLDETRSVQF